MKNIKNKCAKMRSILATQIRNICAIAIVAIIGFSMASCDDEKHYVDKDTEEEADTGRLLLTDIPQKFNGGYIQFPVLRTGGGLRLGFFQSYDILKNNTTTYTKISNGKANMPVWILDGYKLPEKYYGNDTVSFNENSSFSVYKEPTNNEANYTRLGEAFISGTIVFVNGFAEISVKDVWWIVDNVE